MVVQPSLCRNFKGSENIQKKEHGSDSTVLNNNLSSVTLNEVAIKFPNKRKACQVYRVKYGRDRIW